MSRKPPTVVVVDNPRLASRHLPKDEAKRIRDQAIAERETRRKGRTLYRLKRHLAPWYAALTLAAAAGLGWLVKLVDQAAGLWTAVGFACTVGFVGWLWAQRTKRWRTRLYAATIFAIGWLLVAAQTGPSRWLFITLAGGTILLGLRWWKTIRIPHPLAPATPEPERKAGPFEQLWNDHIADQSGVLPKSYLSDKDTSRDNAARYTVNLRPGKQTITQLLGSLERVAGGLMVPVKRVVLEPHPNESPNQGLLTVVKTSPIDETVAYQGARITGEGRHLLDLGPFGDGDGYAQWRMWQPGEKPMTGSWLSGFIVGGTGIGKSRLMELLAAGYMASGYSVVWFADPQGGASSPGLQQYADWYVDSDGVPTMLAALERIAYWRERENSDKKWTRFDPSPERPGIVVFLDECQVTFKKYGARWADLARKTQKVGISFVGLTQYASLENLGGQEPLRSSLLANAIVMKTNSKTNGQLIAGLDFDSEQLPKIPGFGYIIRVDASGRTAPFRSEYLAEPEEWFARYPMPPLDQLSVNAAGDPYKLRRETAVEQQLANRRELEQMRGGSQPPLPTVVDEPAEVVAFPPAPTLAQPELKRAGREAILEALLEGPRTPKVLREATGLSEPRVGQLLKALTEDGTAIKLGHGLYDLSDDAKVKFARMVGRND